MSSKHKRQSVHKWTWKKVSGALVLVPLAVLIWQVWSFYHPASIRKVEVRYVSFRGDALYKFINGDEQLIDSLQLGSSRTRNNALMQQLQRTFSKDVVKSGAAPERDVALFLSLKNVGTDELTTLELIGGNAASTERNLRTNDTLLVCVRLEEPYNRVRVDPVTRVLATTSQRATITIDIPAPRAESVMTKVVGLDDVALDYPPTRK